MNVNQVVAQKLIERLKRAEETGEKFYWVKPFAKGCPRTAVSYDTLQEYRGINRILLDSSKEFLSYRYMQKINENEPDNQYHIRKGSKGNIVIYFNRVPAKDTDGEAIVDEVTGLPVMKSFVRYYTVFDREDVIDQNGVNLPSRFPIEQFDHEDEEEQLQLALLKFNAIVKSYAKKYNVKIIETYQGTEASFSPSQNVIRMPSRECFSSLKEWMGTFFHELAHSTMLPLCRIKSVDEKTITDAMKNYSVEELVAELTSAILMASLNLPTSDTEKNNLAYLQGWSKYLAEKQNSLIYAASQAEKAAELIVSEFEHTLDELSKKNEVEKDNLDRTDRSDDEER